MIFNIIYLFSFYCNADNTHLILYIHLDISF